MDILWDLSYSTYFSFYMLFLFGSVVIAALIVREPGEQLSSDPDPGSFEPVGIALLRGGKNAVIRIVIFSLWQKQAIGFEGSRKDVMITRLDGTKPRLSGIEQEIYSLIQYPRKISEIFADRGMRTKLEKHLSSQRVGLIRSRLCRDQERLGQLWLVNNIIISSIIILAIYGVVRYEHNEGLFIATGIFFVVIVLSVLSPWREQNNAGKKYIKNLQDRFGWVKSDMQKGIIPAGIDPAFAFAVFGVEVFKGSPLYQPVEDAFSVSRRGGGCSGGCGGCSNDSSSSSDSSDSGSGCSGGGCGGGGD